MYIKKEAHCLQAYGQLSRGRQIWVMILFVRWVSSMMVTSHGNDSSQLHAYWHYKASYILIIIVLNDKLSCTQH